MKKFSIALFCLSGPWPLHGFVMPSPTTTTITPSTAINRREFQSMQSMRSSLIALAAAGPTPPFGASPRDKPRRQKKNKYKKSTDEENHLDPLELLMEESKNKLEEIEKKKKNKKKLAAAKARKNNNNSNRVIITDEKEIEEIRNQPRNFIFPDNKDINPNDPASFGFIEIGTVVGAHGVHGEIKVKSSSGFPKRFTEPGIKFFKPYNKRAPRKVVLVSGRPSKDDEYIVQLDETTNRDDAKRLRGGMLFVREEERDSGTTSTTTTTNNEKNNSNNNNDDASSSSSSSPPPPAANQADKEEEDDDEYFISDLVGLEVFLEQNDEEDEEHDDTSTSPLFVGTVAGVVLGEEMCSVPGLGQDMLEINLPRGKGGTTSLRDELVLIPFVPQIVPRVSISQRTVFINPPAGLLDLTYVREEKVRIKGFLPPAATTDDD